jgi:hypothetical protein
MQIVVVFLLFLFPISYGIWLLIFLIVLTISFVLHWMNLCDVVVVVLLFRAHQLRKRSLSQNKRLQFEDGCKAKYLQFFGCSIKCGRLLVYVWLWARIWRSTNGEECSSMKNLTPLRGYAIFVASCVLIEGMHV